MRALLSLLLLGPVGMFLCGGNARGDLVLTSVSQEVSALAPGNLVTQIDENSQLPAVPLLSVFDTSVKGLAVSTQNMEHSPTSINIASHALGSAVVGGLNKASAASLGTVTFTLSLPHTFYLYMGGAVSNGGSNQYVFEGPVGSGVMIDAPGIYSGVLPAGDFTLRLESLVKAGPGVTANANGVANLSLTAVPEPSSFVFVGLVAVAIWSADGIRRRMFSSRAAA